MTGPAREAGLDEPRKRRIALMYHRNADVWRHKFSDAANQNLNKDRRALLAVLEREKQAVNWDEVSIGWQQVYQEAGERWREAFVPLMQGVMEAQGEQMGVALGMEFDVRLLEAEAWFENYTMQFASQVMGETERELAGLLQQAQREGWSIPTMQNHLGQMFRQWRNGNMSPSQFDWLDQRMPAWRRELIARTETIRSSSAGINRLYQNWGVQYTEWYTVEDDRRCPWCAEMHGKIIPIGGTFFEQGQSMSVQIGDRVRSMVFNYEAVKHPPLHPGCRCCSLPWKREWAEVGVEVPAGLGPGAFTPATD